MKRKLGSIFIAAFFLQVILLSASGGVSDLTPADLRKCLLQTKEEIPSSGWEIRLNNASDLLSARGLLQWTLRINSVYESKFTDQFRQNTEEFLTLVHDAVSSGAASQVVYRDEHADPVVVEAAIWDFKTEEKAQQFMSVSNRLATEWVTWSNLEYNRLRKESDKIMAKEAEEFPGKSQPIDSYYDSKSFALRGGYTRYELTSAGLGDDSIVYKELWTAVYYQTIVKAWKGVSLSKIGEDSGVSWLGIYIRKGSRVLVIWSFNNRRPGLKEVVDRREGNKKIYIENEIVPAPPYPQGGVDSIVSAAYNKMALESSTTDQRNSLPTISLSINNLDTLLMPCSVPIKITANEPSGLPMEGHRVVITVQNPEAKGFVTVDQPQALLGADGVHETMVHVTAAPKDKPLSDIPKQVVFGVEVQRKDSGKVVAVVSITRPLVALRIDKIVLLQAVEGAVLIADRRTGVRTWLDTNQPSLPATVVVKVDRFEAVTQPRVIIKPQSSYAAADKPACADSVNLLIPASYVTPGEHNVTVEVQPDGSTEKVSHRVLMVPWQKPRTIKILFVPTDTAILGNAAQGLTAQGTEMMLASFLGGFAQKVKAFMEEIYPVAQVEYAIDPKPLVTMIDIAYAIPGINKANQAENVRRAYNRRNSVSPADFVIAVFPWGKYKGPSGAKIEGAHYGSIVWYPLSIERAMIVANTYPLTTAHEIGHFFLGPKEEYSDTGVGIFLKDTTVFDGRSNGGQGEFHYCAPNGSTFYNLMGSDQGNISAGGNSALRYWVNAETLNRLYRSMGQNRVDPSLIKLPGDGIFILADVGSSMYFDQKNPTQVVTQGEQVRTASTSMIMATEFQPETASVLAQRGTVWTALNTDTIRLHKGSLLVDGNINVQSSNGTVTVRPTGTTYTVDVSDSDEMRVQVLEGSVAIETPSGTHTVPSREAVKVSADGDVQKTDAIEEHLIAKAFSSTPSSSATTGTGGTGTTGGGFIDFSDNFDKGLNNWDISKVQPNLTNGQLFWNEGNHNGVYTKFLIPLENIVIEFDGWTATNGIAIEWKNSQNNGYNVSVGAYFNTASYIGKIDNGNYDWSIKKGVFVQLNKWQHYKLIQNGQSLTVYLDGNYIGAYNTNTSFSGNGLLRFSTYNSRLGIDNVKIYRVSPNIDNNTPAKAGWDVNVEPVNIDDNPDKDIVYLESVADSYVYAYSYSGWNTANWGKYEQLGAGWNPTGGESRAYLKFDLTGIDPNSVNKATLKLYHFHTGGGNAVELGVYRVMSPWIEGNGTYTPSTRAASGELSWVNQPPIDQYPVVYFNPGPGIDKWVEVDVTSLIKAWLTGIPNHGMAIKGGENYIGKTESQYGFRSREFEDVEKRPVLVLHKKKY